MLVLTRKVGERIHIGDSIVLTILRIHGDKVRLGIEAPKDTPILRGELRERLGPGAGASADRRPAPKSPAAVPGVAEI